MQDGGQANPDIHPEGISLLELNSRVKTVLLEALPATCWLHAETSDVRENAFSGHCYLEFVEKETRTGQLVAKARGVIWVKTFRMLKPYFEMETGQAFASGLKVLVKVAVEFHELYGYSLTVVDIDPSYTLGDMLRRRMEIVRQLKADGIFDLNRELPLPPLPNRVAVISSATAAGYGDFLDQLLHNRAGYPFYVKLFPATMQGERTEESVIAALDRIYLYRDRFDVVALIRGGGATSDLNSFDSYLLAANCAQFPLPVVTGIGHERDDTIVDLVAHTRLKTPTAVAEFLIHRMDEAVGELTQLEQALGRLVTDRMARQYSFLQQLVGRLPALAAGRVERYRTELETLRVRLAGGVEKGLAEQRLVIRLAEQYVRLASPEYLLQRGYSLTLRAGRIVKRAAEVAPGDVLTTRWADGEVRSVVPRE